MVDLALCQTVIWRDKTDDTLYHVGILTFPVADVRHVFSLRLDEFLKLFGEEASNTLIYSIVDKSEAIPIVLKFKLPEKNAD